MLVYVKELSKFKKKNTQKNLKDKIQKCLLVAINYDKIYEYCIP